MAVFAQLRYLLRGVRNISLMRFEATIPSLLRTRRMTYSGGNPRLFGSTMISLMSAPGLQR